MRRRYTSALLMATSLAALSSGLDAPARGQSVGMPSGASVIAGQASVSTPSSTSTVINQSTDKAIINWQNFSVASGASVTFQQPGSASITLNRVTGPNASAIDGGIAANGQVWLINGNGIMFGAGSTVNVAGILATTSDIADQDFTGGNYNFSQGSAKPNASVVNQGTIRAKDGGSVVLSGGSVANSGVVQANLGHVVLGGGSTFSVDFDGDNLIRYQVTSPSQAQGTAVSNSGTAAANGGTVLLTARAAKGVVDSVINSTGIVEAKSVSIQNGEVVFDGGDGGVNIGGTVDASGKSAGETGGSVTVTGARIALAGGAAIDASGDAGGGTIAIGGDLHGQGPTPHAATVSVTDASINADAIGSGNGGTIALWSDSQTSFSGRLSAKGGAAGGNGGIVETSSVGGITIGDSARVDTHAPQGADGNWLIDPASDFIIADSGGNITPATIITNLGSGAVTLTTAANMFVNSPITSFASANALSLLAQGDLHVASRIQNGGSGAINLVAGWNGTTLPPGNLTASGVFGNNNGSVFIGNTSSGNGVFVGSSSGTTTVAAYNLTIDGTVHEVQLGYRGTGGGNINAVVSNNLAINSGSEQATNAQIGNGDASGTNGGILDVTGNIAITVGGTTSVSGSSGIAWIGNVAGTGHAESGNLSLITGSLLVAGDPDQTHSTVVNDTNNVITNFITADIVGGDVTLGFTASSGFTMVDRAINYTSSHALTILSKQGMSVLNSIQNAGTGAITLVAGWNTAVAPANVLTTPGAYGLNHQPVRVTGLHGVISNIPVDSGTGTAVGSKGGITTVAANTVVVSAMSLDSMIGYRGTGATGAINISATSASAPNFLDPFNPCGGDGNVCIFSGGGAGSFGPGASAQIGHLGRGVAGTASGAITINATGNIILSGGGLVPNPNIQGQLVSGLGEGTAPNAYALIGNGDASMNVASVDTLSGDISVHATGLFFLGSSSTATSQSWIGNVGGAGTSHVGNVTLISGTNDGNGDISSNLSYDLGTGPGNGGNVLFGITNPDDENSGGVKIDSGIAYTSANSFTLLSGGNIEIEGSLLNLGTGALTLVAGWNPLVSPANVLTTSGGFGSNGGEILIGGDKAEGNVAVGSKGGTTTIAGANVYVVGINGYAQIGYNGTGATGAINVFATNPAAPVVGDNLASCTGGFGNVCVISGSGAGNYAQIGALGYAAGVGTASSPITVNATGNIIVLGGGLTDANTAGTNANAYAQIGNGDASKTRADTVSGDISIKAGGLTAFNSSTTASSVAWIGNRAAAGGSQSGNVTEITNNSSGGFDSGLRFAEDVVGGDVALYVTNPGIDIVVATNYLNSFTSTHTLTYAVAGNLVIQSGVQNSGTGAINFIAGWDGHTTPLASLTNAGVYGNNGKAVTVGGGSAVGNVAIGSKGGATNIAGANVFVYGQNGYAQIGYAGTGATGAINVSANSASAPVIGGNLTSCTGGFGNVCVISVSGAGDYAQIGSLGLAAGNGTASSAITVNATGNIFLLGGGLTGANTAGTNANAYAAIGNGDASKTRSDTVSGDISIKAGGVTALNSSTTASSVAWVGNRAAAGGSQSGNVTEITGSHSGGFDTALHFVEDVIGGDVALYVTSSSGDIVVATDSPNAYSSTHTLTLATAGNVTALSSLQNSGTGAINLIAGWDGHTMPLASLTNAGVYGNNAKGVTIGGASAAGNVAVGSKGGLTNVAGAFANVTATNGYAQLGYRGAATGDITIRTTGGVSLSGGTSDGRFAQIGHDGLLASGNTAGAISITAGGDVVLNGGSATETYSQIGDGGAETNKASTGYSDVAPIGIAGRDIVLHAGNGTASYAQIGNGGYQSGANIASGNATLGGDITVNATGAVTLTGNGAQAYAQIGNGGDMANTGAAAGAGGTYSGNIVVQTTGSPVTLTAGAGANAYVQIGNGGASINTPGGTPANFAISGTIFVSDLTLTGGNTGSNAYSQIGNGDASGTGSGNVNGDITIQAGNITLTGGSAPHSPALIGCAIGSGIVSCTGYDSNPPAPPPPPITDQTSGVLTTLLTNPSNIFTPPPPPAPPPPAMMAMMDMPQNNSIEGGDTEPPSATDSATSSVGGSLSGGAPSRMISLLGGLLQQLIPGAGATQPHGVPPADQDYSSWGNEAFW